SGPIMMWGWTGGLLAGVLGGRPASWLHTPTVLLVRWVRAVAHVTASGPFVTVGIIGIVALMVAVGLLLTGRRYVRPIAGAIAAVVLLGGWVAVPGPEPGSLGSGLVLHTTTPVVLELDGPRRSRDVLETLRHAGVRRIDVVVASDGDRADADAVMALQARFGDIEVVAPPLHRVPTASSLHPGMALQIGSVIVEPTTDGETARLTVRSCTDRSCQDGAP
ncbi:MAG: hypothetical protein ACPHFO_05075, partial [Acidimicrobiales bacterium]